MTIQDSCGYARISVHPLNIEGRHATPTVVYGVLPDRPSNTFHECLGSTRFGLATLVQSVNLS